MERVPVSSSNLLSVGYEPESETLEIEFRSSGIYQYFNVPSFMHERLMAATSVGTFFNDEIKNTFACNKL